MTDEEIIEGLVAHDNYVTEQFFYVKCRPLLKAVMKMVFSGPVDYDEMVGELYLFLMADDAARLRQFQFRSTVYQWIKVVALRYFIRKRNSVIENESHEPLNLGEGGPVCPESISHEAESNSDRIDVEILLDSMSNRRYAEVIRRLVLEDADPEAYAEELGVTVANLYNIKKRAITAISRIATKYYAYGR